MSRSKGNAPNLGGIQDPALRQMLRTFHERIAAQEGREIPESASLDDLGGVSKDDVIRLLNSQISQLRTELGGGSVMPRGTVGGRRDPPPPEPPPPPPPPRPPGGGGGGVGPSRGSERCFVDNGGPYLSFGASFFALLWGYQNQRDRTGQNLEFLRRGGVQHVRALVDVGPSGGWNDREINSQVSGFSDILGACTDWVYDNFDMRVQWTIFGGVDHCNTSTKRSALVTLVTNMAAGRENKIFIIEIANEAWQNGFAGAGGLAELRALTTQAQAATTILVAATSANSEEPAGYTSGDIYTGGVGDVATYHFSRRIVGVTEGLNRPVRQPWEAQFKGGVPVLSSNNEPIGPESSVNSDDDPTRIAMAGATTYLCGVGDYVLHTGPGVRFGGAADLARTPPRSSNFADVHNIDAILDGLRNVRNLLPVTLPNFRRHNTNNGYSSRPFGVSPDDGFGGPTEAARIYQATKDSDVCAVLIGVKGSFNLVARQALSNVKIYHPLSSVALIDQSLANGASIPISPAMGAGLILRGTV